MVAGEFEAGNEVELAGADDVGIPRVEIDGPGRESNGLGRRRSGDQQNEEKKAP